jgi:hypothetical protein
MSPRTSSAADERGSKPINADEAPPDAHLRLSAQSAARSFVCVFPDLKIK